MNEHHLETIWNLYKPYSSLSMHQKTLNERMKQPCAQNIFQIEKEIQYLENKVKILTQDITTFVKST